MRQLAFISILFSLIYGCNGSPDSEPPRHVSVSVSYKSGFRGDSIILRCDGAVFERSLAFSDSTYIPSGYLFTVNEGVHTLEIEDPQMNVRSDTTFQAMPASRTVIETSLDRRIKIINCIIFYVDTNQIALPQPPTHSLQSMLPR